MSNTTPVTKTYRTENFDDLISVVKGLAEKASVKQVNFNGVIRPDAPEGSTVLTVSWEEEEEVPGAPAKAEQ